MRTVWKYPLLIADMQHDNAHAFFDISVPEGADVLYVASQGQGDLATIWFDVVTTRQNVVRRIYIVGTGHAVPPAPSVLHIGSAIDGPFVWHLFEESADV